METAAETETGALHQRNVSALGHLPCHLWFFSITGVLLAGDLWSKHWAFSVLGPDQSRTILPGTIELRRSLNAGAVFGSFTGHVGLFVAASLFALGFVFYLFASSRSTQRWLHVALACILAGALGNLYDRARITADVVTIETRSGAEVIRIGKIVSGPEDPVLLLGEWPEGVNARPIPAANVISIRRQGVVRDMIKFVPRFPGWVPWLGGRDAWPWIFNIADASLVSGVGVMLVVCFPAGRRPAPVAVSTKGA